MPEAHDQRNHDLPSPNQRPVSVRLRAANQLGMTRARKYHVAFESLEAAALEKILQKQGYRCVYCPRRIVHRFSLDHITALSEKGTHTLANIQFTCVPCNSRKKEKIKPETTWWCDCGVEIDHTKPKPDRRWGKHLASLDHPPH